MIPTLIADHAGDADAELRSQWDDSAKVHALLAALVGPAQELEQALYDVMLGRTIDTAVGAQLDQLGTWFGRLRGGMDDDTYRVVIRADMLTLYSDATGPDIIACVSLLVGVPVRYWQAGTAYYYLQWEVAAHTSAAILAILPALLLRLAPAGVGYDAVEADDGPSGAFQFDTGPGFDLGTLGNLVGSG